MNYKSIFKKWWFWLVIILILITVIMFIQNPKISRVEFKDTCEDSGGSFFPTVNKDHDTCNCPPKNGANGHYVLYGDMKNAKEWMGC